MLENLLAWCREKREQLRRSLDLMENGRMSIYEGRGTDRNVTPLRIEEIRASRAELDQILVGHSRA
jgi:hypothetical protein